MRPCYDNEELDERRHILITYLMECVRVEDWHGVMDAAADLREVDAKLELLDALETTSHRSGESVS